MLCSNAKLIPSDSEIDIKDLNPRIKTLLQKLKNYACEDWVVLDEIIKQSIKMFECQYKENKQNKKGDNK